MKMKWNEANTDVYAAGMLLLLLVLWLLLADSIVVASMAAAEAESEAEAAADPVKQHLQELHFDFVSSSFSLFRLNCVATFCASTDEVIRVLTRPLR